MTVPNSNPLIETKELVKKFDLIITTVTIFYTKKNMAKLYLTDVCKALF